MTFIIKKNMKRFVTAARSILPFKPKSEGVRILMYHSIGGRPQDHRLATRVPAQNFRAQLDELSHIGYETMTISELLKSGLSPRANKAIAITFDDGYKDNITKAASALKIRGIKATFFITTSNIEGKSRKIWIGGRAREYMDWEDVRRLSSMGFEIGSHMVEHLDLTSLDRDQLQYQFEGSKKAIAEKAGVEPITFSYPYGRINDLVVDMARSSGYIGGCSSFKGLNKVGTNNFILRRTEIDGYDIIHDFIRKLSGYYD